MNRGFTSIFTLDLATPTLEFEADHIVGNSPLVYASEDVLIVAEPSFAGWWFWGNDDLDESTNLHTFDISNPGTTLYTGSGRVNGTVLDSSRSPSTKASCAWPPPPVSGAAGGWRTPSPWSATW